MGRYGRWKIFCYSATRSRTSSINSLRGKAFPRSAAVQGHGGNAYDEKGNLYTCEFRERRVTRTAKNGKVDVIAARFEGKRLNAPNDVVVRRDGNVYFTDPAFGNQEDTRELDFNGVFRVTTRGQIEAIAKWKTRPNGLALSSNGRTLYVSDSDGQSITRSISIARVRPRMTVL